MSRFTTSYDELVANYKQELLNNEELMDKFEERFEKRLVAKSMEKSDKRESR